MDEGEEPDARIVSRVRAGALTAYATLVRRHERAVFAIAVRALADRAVAENLVQQTFLNAYEHLATFEVQRDFGVWVRSIARNVVRDELRRRERDNHHLRVYRAQLLPDGQSDEHADHQGKRLEETLRGCIQQLAPAAAEALTLRYERDLPLDEVARNIGRTVVATRQFLFRIRLTLRDCMQKHGAFE